MTTVFKTIETIGGGIYFVPIIFMKRQHFPKNDKQIIRFVLFKSFRENPPNSFDGFQLTVPIYILTPKNHIPMHYSPCPISSKW